MKFIPFAKQNIEIGKGQEHIYNVIPAYRDADDQEGKMMFCVQFDENEIAEIIKNRTIWLTQLTFRQNFQPISISVESPFYKHVDAFMQYFYKRADAETGIWVWNKCDLPAPLRLEIPDENFGHTIVYTLDKSKPYRAYTSLNLPIGAYYITELQDHEQDWIQQFGKHLLQRVAGPSLTYKYQIPRK